MYLNKRTGELHHKDMKQELTKYETTLIQYLSDNHLKTYEEIYHILYGVRTDQLNKSEVHQITNLISRLRKKGINIRTKKSFGVIMEDVVCINNNSIRNNSNSKF